VPSPIYYVGGPLPTIPRGQINFIIPNGARTSGYADLQVVRVSTGQILGAAQVPMTAAAPGAFIYPQGQTGATLYAAAINQDGSLNAPANCSPPLPFTTCGPVTRGQAVSLYMTGQGHVPGLPSDGVPATAPISAPVPITVLLNGIDVNGYPGESGVQHILYSGIDELPGMWQINVLIPKTVSVTSGVGTWFAVIANGVSNWDSSSGFKTYIYVK
jgi:uncharacterized protein (TIGR03437 family)